MDWFNLYGLIIIVVIMIPNIIFGIKNKEGFENKYNNKIVETFEQIGRFSCFFLMIFNIPFLTIGYWFNNAETIYIIINVILTIIYCIGWIVFWNKNNVIKSLILSITPSLIFILSGIITLNIPLMFFSLIFAICHIMISYKNAIL